MTVALESVVVSPAHLEASLCRDSFFDFFCRFWSQIYAQKLVLNWHIEYLCHTLQEIAERLFEGKPSEGDLVINVSPGTTKSTICSVMLPAWCWIRDPTLRIICGSYTSELSWYLATFCRDLVTSDKYRQLFPEVKLVEEQKKLLINTRGGQRISASTGGSITGMHGHLIIIDDPINPKEAASAVTLKAANDWIDRTLLTRKIDQQLTTTVMIMQRLHEEDPTGHFLAKEGVKVRHICLPALLSSNVKPAALSQYYQGGLFDPKRLPFHVLKQTEALIGEYAFAGQYMQSPVPEGLTVFRTDMIRIEHSAPSLRQVVRYWDKAATLRSGAFTVGLKLGRDADGAFWILDVVRGQWDPAARERIIRQTAEMDGRSVLIGIEQEPGSGGKESAQATLRNLAGFRVILDRPVGDKETRADPCARQVNGGSFRIVKGSWNKVLLEEMAQFPHSRFKDQVDALSGAFALLTRKPVVVGGLGR